MDEIDSFLESGWQKERAREERDRIKNDLRDRLIGFGLEFPKPLARKELYAIIQDRVERIAQNITSQASLDKAQRELNVFTEDLFRQQNQARLAEENLNKITRFHIAINQLTAGNESDDSEVLESIKLELLGDLLLHSSDPRWLKYVNDNFLERKYTAEEIEDEAIAQAPAMMEEMETRARVLTESRQLIATLLGSDMEKIDRADFEDVAQIYTSYLMYVRRGLDITVADLQDEIRSYLMKTDAYDEIWVKVVTELGQSG